MKFKHRQNSSRETEVKKVVTSGGQGPELGWRGVLSPVRCGMSRDKVGTGGLESLLQEGEAIQWVPHVLGKPL